MSLGDGCGGVYERVGGAYIMCGSKPVELFCLDVMLLTKTATGTQVGRERGGWGDGLHSIQEARGGGDDLMPEAWWLVYRLSGVLFDVVVGRACDRAVWPISTRLYASPIPKEPMFKVGCDGEAGGAHFIHVGMGDVGVGEVDDGGEIAEVIEFGDGVVGAIIALDEG